LNFTKRSYQQEILDQENIPFADIKKNMQELDFINTWLGGHHISLLGFKKLTGERKKISVCEIGCGGGDNLKAIYRWAIKHQLDISLTGIDIKQECIEFAREHCAEMKNANFICSDYRHVYLPVKPDIIFSSLFCHHFDDAGVVNIFRWMGRNSQRGFFINDLQRHPLAYYSIKILTTLFSKSYMVKNDAPLSVCRGFSKAELKKMLLTVSDHEPAFSHSIQWRWAFRWLVIGYNDNES
jgi:2-polyprenyl-3-methyl-5-hydroxy-6-metoxy-1,4-benzoquinol methylase